LHVLAMLHSGLDEKRARPEAAALAARLEKDYSATRQRLTLELHPFRSQINGNLTPLFTMTLMGAAAFLLLIACTNVANLLLARGLSRKREITLRTALGAKPTRVVRQLLSVFVCAQVSLALILLTGAGLMIKGLANMLGDARSYGPKTLLTVHVDLRGSRYEDPQKRKAFFNQVIERFEGMPGVVSASV